MRRREFLCARSLADNLEQNPIINREWSYPATLNSGEMWDAVRRKESLLSL